MTAHEQLLGGDAPAYPDFPSLGADALLDADLVVAGRYRLVGEEYELGPSPDWQHNPSRDKEWLIAQHKHYWSVHLVHAAAVTGDPGYLSTWSRLVGSWLAEMGTGFVAQSDAQVEAKRIENTVWALSLLPDAPWQGHIEPALLHRLIARLGHEAQYVAAHLKPVRNHRTFQLYAVALVAVLFPPADDRERLRDLALCELTKNLLTEIGVDGVHVEMSTHYHQLVTETAVGFLELCDRNDIAVDSALRERVHAAEQWSAWLQWPDADIPLLGDSDTGDHRDLLRRGSRLFDDAGLLFGATLGARGVPYSAASRHFPASGYTVLTDGWGNDAVTQSRRQHVVVDTAVLGEGSHSHYDLLSLTYYADGGPAIIDPGRFTYSSDPDEDGHDWRHHFKATAAHNTVTVDGLDQTRYLSRTKHGPDVVLVDPRRDLGARTDWVAGTARSQHYAPLHRRTVVFPGRQYLLVLDRLIGVDGAEHRYDLRWHLPDLAVSLDETTGQPQVRTPRCRITSAPPPSAVVDLQRDWVSRRYGYKDPAAVLNVAATSADDVWFATAVTPRSGPSVDRVERLQTPEGLAVRVSGTDRGMPFVDVMLFCTTGVLEAYGATLEGGWVLIRRNGIGQLDEVVGDGVHRLELDGITVPLPAGGPIAWSPIGLLP